MTIGDEIEQTRRPDPQELDDNAPRPMMCGDPSHPAPLPRVHEANKPFTSNYGIGAVDEMLRSYSSWLDRSIAMKEEKLSDPAMTVEVWRLMQGEIRGLRLARGSFMEMFNFSRR